MAQPETLPEERDRLKTAYSMGYERFSDVEENLTPEDIGFFHDTAVYANHVLPELRKLAGFNDPTGKGTYQERPNEELEHFYQELVETWNDGAYDAADGREKDHNDTLGD